MPTGPFLEIHSVHFNLISLVGKWNELLTTTEYPPDTVDVIMECGYSTLHQVVVGYGMKGTFRCRGFMVIIRTKFWAQEFNPLSFPNSYFQIFFWNPKLVLEYNS